MEQFSFSLSDAEKTYLKDLVRASIRAGLDGQPPSAALDKLPPPADSDKLRQHLGAFVTLKLRGRLRGCIGHIVADAPLAGTIAGMAQAAAFEDPRFAPLSASEAGSLEIEISVLSPIAVCPDPALVQVGRHGLIVRRGHRQGLLLPQVATEWGWDAPTFLAHTCQKAGLPQNCWQQPGTDILWFEAVVF